MKYNLHVINAIKSIAFRYPNIVWGLLIFSTCLFVYLSNGSDFFLGSSDNIPNSLLAFNWLENQTLDFNRFQNSYPYLGGESPYFFAKGLNGELTSRYPIGTAVITFPLYVGFYLYLKLDTLVQSIRIGQPVDFIDIASQDFRIYRTSFSKLAGAIATAFSVVLFYFTVRLKFSQSIALISTFIFAFATSSWVLNSQDLRQHTISNLVLITIIFCLMKADRRQGKARRILLLLAGIFCGLLPSVRVTSGIFSLMAALYTLSAFRKEAIFFLLGLPSVLLHFAWNAYYFGFDNLISGGYVEQFENRPSTYKFTLTQFRTAALGLLISPSEGLFAYSPVLLFAIPGAYQVFRHRAGRDEKLLLCLTVAAIGLFINYGFYGSWAGGSDSYGCRFLTDTLPVACLLVAYCLAAIVRPIEQVTLDRHRPVATTKLASGLLTLFLVTTLVSTGIQAIGAYSSTDWGASPIPVLADRSRLWQLQDSRIERHFRNLLIRIHPPIHDRKQYVRGLDGRVNKVEVLAQGNVTDISNGLVIESKRRRLVRATLVNTGTSPWFGYQTGMVKQGETKLRVHFVDANGNKFPPRESRWLNIAGMPTSGETTEAIGRIMFPREPGTYQMVFDVFAWGLDNAPNKNKPPVYALDVTVVPRS
ncbi:hypothetical protein [Thermocoleostomius sinensis]|uniref:Glycosyltransferase RgtA/B/C/D-like domain-containing protein n=1 Tax=Thermocoleostomius sinensis A174 TaxID=2016057 RepID=A0A9E8ZEI6_9CYAN|nr:hypothetical protein [Thermocoleostomius sinensis]WAL61356.1 hypothetical protein OXH18_05020 [Thermocoleostomius sinensis A174]